jgi:hypothetical protein
MHRRLLFAGIGLMTALGLVIAACGGGASPAPSLNLPTLGPTPSVSLPAISAGIPSFPSGALPSGLVLPSGVPMPSGLNSATAKTIQLAPQNNSGVSGVAFVADLGNGQTFVAIGVTPAVATNYPATITTGPCATPGTTAKWTLTNAVNGVSQSTVSASFADVTSGTNALVLWKSPSEMQTAVACGDIK